MRVLLDVNVLIALLDAAHVFSSRVYQWLDKRPRLIATCPIVENGVLRVLSSPGYSATHRATPSQHRAGVAQPHGSVGSRVLARRRVDPRRSAIDPDRLHGHRQITDAYLLALVVHHGGSLATLDAAIPMSVVRGAAKKHLTLV